MVGNQFRRENEIRIMGGGGGGKKMLGKRTETETR